jgi:hypothetical protein
MPGLFKRVTHYLHADLSPFSIIVCLPKLTPLRISSVLLGLGADP